MHCKRVYMPHAPCRPLPFYGNLAQRYKLSCKIISSNLANWLHGILPGLWHGGMGILLHGTHASLNSVSIKSITRWWCIFKIHMIYTYTDYTIYMNTLISFHHTKQASSCLRTILPLCHVASLNVSVYAPVVVTSNSKQCKSCSK